MNTAQEALSYAAELVGYDHHFAPWNLPRGVGDSIRGACKKLGVNVEEANALLLTRIPAKRVANPKQPGKTIHPIDHWNDTTDLDEVRRVLRGE